MYGLHSRSEIFSCKMTIQLGDFIAIFMVLWKLTEHIYIFFTYQYEYRNALPEVQSIVDSLRQGNETPESRKRPPRAITAGAASAYGEECLRDPESRRHSIKRPVLRFIQRRNAPSQRDMTEALILSQIKNHNTLHQLLQIITPIHRSIDEHWDQRYIRFTNVVGAKHQLFVESCKSPEVCMQRVLTLQGANYTSVLGFYLLSTVHTQGLY